MEERILVIDDDVTLARLMRLQLERAGYQVSTCLDGSSGLCEARNWKPHLILLDVLLPGADGWSICEQLKTTSEAPVMFITALETDRDMTRGLELGADDYIVKPFSHKELISRVKAALHRAQRAASRGIVYENGRLFVDLEAHTVRVDGRRVFLTPLEYRLLAVLIQEAGQVIPHTTLLRHVWGPQCEGQRQYLKLYIWYLRQKIEADPRHPALILTERGAGYRLAAPGQMP